MSKAAHVTPDRRATTRDLDDILRDDERMANLAMNRGQMVRELREALAHARALNERLRRVIADQAALLETSEPRDEEGGA